MKQWALAVLTGVVLALMITALICVALEASLSGSEIEGESDFAVLYRA